MDWWGSISGPAGAGGTAVCDDALVSYDLAVWDGDRPLDDRQADCPSARHRAWAGTPSKPPSSSWRRAVSWLCTPMALSKSAFGITRDRVVAHQWVVSGPGWALVQLSMAEEVLALGPCGRGSGTGPASR